MSKKSIFSLILAVILSISLQPGTFAAKESTSSSTTTTEKSDTKTKSNEDSENEDDDTSSKKSNSKEDDDEKSSSKSSTKSDSKDTDEDEEKNSDEDEDEKSSSKSSTKSKSKDADEDEEKASDEDEDEKTSSKSSSKSSTKSKDTVKDDEEDSKSSKKSTDKDEEDEDDKDSFPDLTTDYYLLADLATGKVLKSKNGNKKVYPASTTKILTAIIALEECELSDVVTATHKALKEIDNDHSHMGILIDEELTVEQLLYGLLVGSANDAANVLAIHISKDLDEFAKLMNKKAKEIGAKNSNFVNAHGFHDDEHYTTINDLAKIAQYSMQNETFRKIVSTSKYEIPPTNKYKDKKNNNTRYLSNTNMFMSNNKTSKHIYKNAIGIKTGHTDEAGYCLVSAAKKNDTELLSIVMKCKNSDNPEKAYSFIDSRALLDYGFSHYKSTVIGEPTDIVEASEVKKAKDGVRVSLSPKETVSVLLPIDADIDAIETEVKKNENLMAPISKGDVLGSITYKLNGEELKTVELVAGNDVERDFFLHILYFIGDHILIIILLVIVGLCVYIYFKYLKRSNRRKRRKRLGRLDNTETMKRRRR